MAVEVALLDVMQAARANPVALVVGGEEVARRVEAEAVRRAQAGRPPVEFTAPMEVAPSVCITTCTT